MDVQRLAIYPTVVIVQDEMFVHFELTCICKWGCMLEAAATMFMLHYVLDVQYARQMISTYAFFDVWVGRVDGN